MRRNKSNWERERGKRREKEREEGNKRKGKKKKERREERVRKTGERKRKREKNKMTILKEEVIFFLKRWFSSRLNVIVKDRVHLRCVSCDYGTHVCHRGRLYGLGNINANCDSDTLLLSKHRPRCWTHLFYLEGDHGKANGRVKEQTIHQEYWGRVQMRTR